MHYAAFLSIVTIVFGLTSDARIFYKKLGSAPSTKSFLIWYEEFAILVLNVS